MSSRSLSVQTNTLPSVISKVLIFIYGAVCYLVFLAAFAYLIGFVGNLLVPKSIDSGTPPSFPRAVLIDLGLIALFGIQHAVMAREKFKKWWTRIIPTSMERSTFVLIASVLLLFFGVAMASYPTSRLEYRQPNRYPGFASHFLAGLANRAHFHFFDQPL